MFEPNVDGKSTLIHFQQGKPEYYKKLTDRIEAVLQSKPLCIFAALCFESVVSLTLLSQ